MLAYRHILSHLFATHASKPLRRLMASVGILHFAASSIALFEPIYLYTLGLGLKGILLYYLVLYLILIFLYPLGAVVARRIGLQHAILFSSPFLILTYLSLYAMKANPAFVIGAVAASALQIALYWPAFHAEMIEFGNDVERGKEISNVAGIISIASVLGPALGGLLVAAAGFPALFVAASALIAASNLPLLAQAETRRRDGFDYAAAFRRLAAPQNRRRVIAYLGFGEDLIGLAVWPVFLFTVLRGFSETGLAVSASLLITACVMLFVGRLADLQSRHAVQRTGTIFLSAAWILRAFANSPVGVFGADLFYRVSGFTMWIPMASMMYGDAKRDGSLESIMLFEMSLAIGKVLAAAAGIALLFLFPGSFQAIFLLAAGMTMLYAFFR